MTLYKHSLIVSTWRPRGRVHITEGESIEVDGRQMVKTLGGFIEPANGWHGLRHHAIRAAAQELEAISQELADVARSQREEANELVLAGQREIKIPMGHGVARTGD